MFIRKRKCGQLMCQDSHNQARHDHGPRLDNHGSQKNLSASISDMLLVARVQSELQKVERRLSPQLKVQAVEAVGKPGRKK